MIFGFALKMGESLPRFPQDILFPIEKFLPEILKLSVVHESFVVGRTILSVFNQKRGRLH
jgi:hypothetical protein